MLPNHNRYPLSWFLPLFLLLGPVTASWAQESGPGFPALEGPLVVEEGVDNRELLQEAGRLEAEGALAEATDKYRAWLDGSANPLYLARVLMRAAGIQEDPEQALELLARYTAKVSSEEERTWLLTYRAGLLEMLGRIEQAAALYQELEAGTFLYETALLLYEQGRFQEAEGKLRLIITRPGRPALAARVDHLLARVYQATDRETEAEVIYRRLAEDALDQPLAPVYLLSYLEFLIQAGRHGEAKLLFEQLERRFAGTPEYALARGLWRASPDERVAYAPAPSRLLSSIAPGAAGESGGVKQQLESARAESSQPESTQAESSRAESARPEAARPIRIQTGSFQMLENAQYMVRDLAGKGFSPLIVEKLIRGSKYFRVVIGPVGSMDRAQALLIRLKEAGFEGMLLFED